MDRTLFANRVNGNSNKRRDVYLVNVLQGIDQIGDDNFPCSCRRSEFAADQ